MEKLRDALYKSRQHQRYELLTGAGFPIAPDAVGVVHEKNVAAQAQVAGLHIGRLAVLFFLLFIITGGSVVAIDTLAGEKERGTLETLLTTSIARSDIITAKHLVILTVAVVIALIQSLNLLVYIAFKVIPLPENMSFDIPPGTVALVLLFLLPVAGLASSILLLTSGYAKTYKEAQLYFFPVFLLSLIPALAPFLPGITLRSAIVAVPVANIAVAVKELLVGDLDWPMMILAWLVTAAAAVWVRRLAVRTLSTERLIVPSTAEMAGAMVDRSILFQRQVLPAFALIWAVFFLVSILEENVEIRAQALINLVVIFLGASLFLIRRYRLPWKEVLAVRSVRPLVWPLVIIGAPAGLLTASGVFQLVSYVLPVPPEILEEFSNLLFPEDVPVWQLVFFVAVLPGVCEEVTFRGVLLHGLRRQFHPVGLALIVGFIFGLFHIALFRIIPVTFLGILLAGVTLLTGSIFPAMLWHTLTNAAGIVAQSQLESLTEYGVATYLVAALVVVMVFALLWRFRTPYPDLRGGGMRRTY
jgi:membrane protease YdiL (CAAX protease family)/ABC-type transport system involved in multi-copper enzyme maturation permease subunit